MSRRKTRRRRLQRLQEIEDSKLFNQVAQLTSELAAARQIIQDIEVQRQKLLDANEILVVGNKQLMSNMAESTSADLKRKKFLVHALAESTERNQVLRERLVEVTGGPEWNKEIEKEVRQRKKAHVEAMNLQRQIQVLEKELRSSVDTGEKEAAKLTEANRKLEARIETQAQMNTALTNECKELRKNADLVAQVRNMVSRKTTSHRKSSKHSRNRKNFENSEDSDDSDDSDSSEDSNDSDSSEDQKLENSQQKGTQASTWSTWSDGSDSDYGSDPRTSDASEQEESKKKEK